MPETVDAVVVGSGPNGLVGANLLADAGWSVVVVEAEATAGGGVRSAELTAPGYVSDLCSAFYPLSHRPAPLAALDLGEYGLRWSHAARVLTHVRPDGSTVAMSRDIAATSESLEQFADGDGERWRSLFDDWRRVSPGLLRALFTPFPPIRSATGMVRSIGLGDSLRLLRRFLMPSQALGQELFRGEGARLLLAGSALHADLTPGDALSAGYGWLLAMLGQQNGFPVPVGGAGALTEAMIRRLRHRGGEVVCSARVDRIEVRGGAVVGVHTVDGRRWGVRRAVLADVAVPSLYQELLDPNEVPDRLLSDLGEFQFDSSTVKVDWALSGPVPWQVEEAVGAGTVHLGVDLAGLARYAAALETGDAPSDPFVICGQMTTADASRSPAGTESLWAYSHLPHRSDWSAGAVAELTQKIENAIERHAPGFGSRVLARHVAGPADLERENANLVGGSLAGGTAAIHQQLVFRPTAGLGRADTPVDGLYLASAGAHPGGGVHGGPGANAARAALARRSRVSGWLYGATIRGLQRHLYRPGPVRSVAAEPEAEVASPTAAS